MGRTVGIDLGTTYSLIAFLDKASGRPQCIKGPYGETLCPSIVSVDADGSVVVGEARAAAAADPAGAHHLFREAAYGPRCRRRSGRAPDLPFPA